jgi:hypothetical protein
MTEEKAASLGIFYYGASGGFYVLWLLLLSQKFNCVFRGDTQDLDQVMQQHWNIKSIDTWKKSEVWPDNIAMKTSTLVNKIYFFCNPTKEYFDDFKGTRVVVYTDIDTQYYLASTKKAFWFSDGLSLKNYQNLSFLQLYSEIKSPEWPVCNDIGEFEQLPYKIRQTCIDEFGFDNILDQTKFVEYFKNARSSIYKNEKVLGRLVDNIDFEKAEIVVKLQDTIKDAGASLYNKLGIQHTMSCQEFTDFYINLHTTEQQSYLLTKGQ